MSKTALIALSIAAVVAIASWVLFLPGFFYVHDFLHAARIAEMARGLTDFHLPVRWSEAFGYGYGMPLFLFYAPLPFFVGALSWLSGVSIITSVKMIFLLSTIMAALGSYQVARKITGVMPALVAMAAFTLAPYRGVNLVVRGAVSESWAIATYPWILLGILLIMRRERWGVAILVSALTTLLLSHNISTLLFIPLTILIIALWMIWKKYKGEVKELISTGTQFLLSYTLSIGLAAFYIFPAFLEKHFTVVEQTILDGYFEYSLHFVSLRQFVTENWGYGGSTFGPADDMSFFLGYGQIFGLIVLCISAGVYFWKQGLRAVFGSIFEWLSKEKHFFVSIFLCLTLVTLFMAQYKSAFLWNVLPLLEYIQFPWRWLGATSIFLALSLAVGLELLQERKKRFFSLVILLIIAVTSWRYFVPDQQLSATDEFYFTDQVRISEELSPVLPDYISTAFSQPDKDISQYQSLAFDDDQLTPVGSLVHSSVDLKTYQLELATAAMVVAPIAYFPGWSATIDAGEQVELVVDDNGLIGAYLPAGSHTLTFAFNHTPIRQISDIITLISVILSIWLLVKASRRRGNWVSR
ncbi:MAG: hypothetical protein WDZ94_04355 [Patescibacteria group bacterium]